MAKLRLGVIGAGSWAVRSHLPNLARWRDSGDLRFSIVNRRDPELLERVRVKFDFDRATTDWREVIAERPDLVVIGSPASSHFEQAKAALEAGAAVLCEKPFTIRPEHAWELAATVARTGRP